MANSVKTLHKAKKEKNDEFYTQRTDVEKELIYYRPHFKNKVVLCNCDDESSAFWEYFHLLFGVLGLKKLIATHYDKEAPTYKVEYSGGNDNDTKCCVTTPLDGNGDFRNQECIELLKEADIVVTNPPFSLFREYVAQLMEYNKKFIIIGNQNAITYKEIFPLLKDNKIWLGESIHSGDRVFYVPDSYPLTAKNCGIDNLGRHWVRVTGVRWFTNIETPGRHNKMILWKKYNPSDYPKYDNYNAIEVKKTDWIPEDYFDEMGVPITFMDKYCPEQFDIVGSLITNNPSSYSYGVPYINKKKVYARILIKRK